MHHLGLGLLWRILGMQRGRSEMSEGRVVKKTNGHEYCWQSDFDQIIICLDVWTSDCLPHCSESDGWFSSWISTAVSTLNFNGEAGSRAGEQIFNNPVQKQYLQLLWVKTITISCKTNDCTEKSSTYRRLTRGLFLVASIKQQSCQLVYYQSCSSLLAVLPWCHTRRLFSCMAAYID